LGISGLPVLRAWFQQALRYMENVLDKVSCRVLFHLMCAEVLICLVINDRAIGTLIVVHVNATTLWHNVHIGVTLDQMGLTAVVIFCVTYIIDI
jgi:hypothetical protein